MKVGRDSLSEDLSSGWRRCATLVGPEAPLMVDANMRWSVEEAIAAARELARFGVRWLEEPIAPGRLRRPPPRGGGRAWAAVGRR